MKNIIIISSLLFVTYLWNSAGADDETNLNDSASISPYLQSPTPSSIYICWRFDADTNSTVEYGTTSLLGTTMKGTYETIADQVIWHSVELTGLIPNTVYYYKCISDTVESEIYKFRTPKQHGSNDDHFRLLVISDNQDTPAMASQMIMNIKNG